MVIAVTQHVRSIRNIQTVRTFKLWQDEIEREKIRGKYHAGKPEDVIEKPGKEYIEAGTT